jgi:hypothetical protein
MKIREITAQGMKDAAFKMAVIVTPVLVSIMLGCLVTFFRWSVAQHHAAEMVAREHSKAIEAIVEWQSDAGSRLRPDSLSNVRNRIYDAG